MTANRDVAVDCYRRNHGGHCAGGGGGHHQDYQAGQKHGAHEELRHKHGTTFENNEE